MPFDARSITPCEVTCSSAMDRCSTEDRSDGVQPEAGLLSIEVTAIQNQSNVISRPEVNTATNIHEKIENVDQGASTSAGHTKKSLGKREVQGISTGNGEMDLCMDDLEELPSEPTASTSKDEEPNHTILPEALKHSRKSLPLLPRMSQYERHPLLQVRSGTGLSEFEMFLLEKELFKRRSSADDQWAETESTGRPSDTVGCTSHGSIRERPLIPRSAHYEPHPLLKKSESGICELELYLMEKEEEAMKRDQDEEEMERMEREKDKTFHWKSTGSHSKLEPRLNQWEKHALLEIKDEEGLSEVDRLFLESEEQERGKCGAECVCKNATCKRCKTKQQQQPDHAPHLNSFLSKSDARPFDVSPSATGITLFPTPKPSGQQKRVRFEKQKNEADDSGIASSDANQSGSRNDDANMTEGVTTSSNAIKRLTGDVDEGNNQPQKGSSEKEKSSFEENSRDEKKNKRGRTNTSPAIKKSCCMS